MRHQAATPWLFLAPNLVGFLAFTFLPVVAALGLAFCSWDLFQPPTWVGLDNFYELIGFRERQVPRIAGLPWGGLVAGWLAFGLLVFWVFRHATGGRKAGAIVVWWVGAVALLLANYEPVNDRFWYFMGNTLYLLIGLPISMACSLALALLLNEKIYGRNLFKLMVFLPSVVSGVGVYLLWKWIFNSDYGLINGLLSMAFDVQGPAWLEAKDWAKNALIIMNVWAVAGGANMVLYLAALQNVDPGLYEAAEIDGAGPWRKFLAITWPMITPTTAFVFTMGLIGGFQGGFDSAFVMTQGGPAGATTTISYFIYENGFRYFYMGRAAAASWILFAMVLFITWLNWRWMANKIHY